MNTILLYIRLPHPQTECSLSDPLLCRFQATLQSTYKRRHPSSGEYCEGYLSEVFAHLSGWFSEGNKFRIVTNHAKILIEHSDLSERIKCGEYSLRDVPGKWVSRDTGEVKDISSAIVCVNESPLILCLDRAYRGEDITILDLGNYGIKWEEHVTRTNHDNLTWADDEQYRCKIAGDFQGDGLAVLACIYDHYAKVCRDNRFGEPSYTYASQGNGAYYGRRNPVEIRQTTDSRALAIEILSHYGGVRLPFGYGRFTGECAMYDISAFYPSIARSAEAPTSLVGVWSETEESLLPVSLQYFYCIAKVDLRSPDGRYPHRKFTETTYPTEDFTAYLHHPDLQRALTLGHVTKVHCICTYDRGKILADSMDNLLSARAKCLKCGDKLGEHICKCIAVGWLGKLGSKLSVWEDVDDVIPPADNAEWNTVIHGLPDRDRHRSIYGRVQRKREDLVPYLGGIAIAGAITAYGRELLWSLIDYAGPENVLYADTDGIICCRAAMRRLDALTQGAGFRPGVLRRVATGTECTIASIGVYAIGDKQGHQGYGPEIEGGYDPSTSPLTGSFAATMHRASQAQFTFYHHHERSE